LKLHIMRRREVSDTVLEQTDTTENGISEIIKATLCALHCYIVHTQFELYRLQRDNGDSHFMSAVDSEIQDSKAENDEKMEAKDSENVMLSLNFGQSVLNWFRYGKEPKLGTFRESIVENKDSTINGELYLTFVMECFLKLQSKKHKCFELDELLALKIYTDTNDYQSKLRRAHWESASEDEKQRFYHWALKLYETLAFHSQPIPRWAFTDKKPMTIYHGINRVFVIDNVLPKYNGPTSTTVERTVAHQFTNETGLLWTIKPSYQNYFKFVKGLSVQWISQHKNESEILILDQYLPINNTHNFFFVCTRL